MNSAATTGSAVTDDRGQSLVELALALPLLLLVVLGIVDVTRIYAYKGATTNAAQAAAIHAARDPRALADSVCQRARDELGVGSAVNPCTTAPIVVVYHRGGADCPNDFGSRLYQCNGAGGADVTVTVTYSVPLLSAFLVARAFQLNPVQVSATAAIAGLGE